MSILRNYTPYGLCHYILSPIICLYIILVNRSGFSLADKSWNCLVVNNFSSELFCNHYLPSSRTMTRATSTSGHHWLTQRKLNKTVGSLQAKYKRISLEWFWIVVEFPMQFAPRDPKQMQNVFFLTISDATLLVKGVYLTNGIKMIEKQQSNIVNGYVWWVYHDIIHVTNYIVTGC